MRMRLISLSLALLWVAATPAADGSEEARAMISRMNTALIKRNYDGVLTHQWKGGREVLRIIHRNQDGRMVERVVSTDGSGHEEVRNGTRWVAFNPGKRIAWVQTQNRSFGYITALNGLSAESEKLYAISSPGTQRLKGWPKPMQLVSVLPRDGLRYGYRFWLDQDSAMPVKTQLVTQAGEVIEEISFITLTLPETISDELLKPDVDTKGFRWMRLDVPPGVVKQAFTPRANLLPTGFRVLNFNSAAAGSPPAGPQNRFIVSDGVAWVSVFVDGVAKQQELGAGQMGTYATYVTRLDDYYITVVGEVPPATVKGIAEAVRPE
jgi:sigma-E factor negative regulatory protein RseB